MQNKLTESVNVFFYLKAKDVGLTKTEGSFRDILEIMLKFSQMSNFNQISENSHWSKKNRTLTTDNGQIRYVFITYLPPPVAMATTASRFSWSFQNISTKYK